MTQHIIHTLVKATAFENVCHFRTQVSAIVTHFLQAVFLTVHYVILLRQIPSVLSVANAETQVINPLILLQYLIIYKVHVEKHTASGT